MDDIFSSSEIVLDHFLEEAISHPKYEDNLGLNEEVKRKVPAESKCYFCNDRILDNNRKKK